MSDSPRVRRMVMFKHGVAFIERGGPADGAFELSFKRDEMNDVLKSLSVRVAGGDATVGALAFEKPEDPEEALERRKLKLNPASSLQGLLVALRGRRVAVEAGGVRHEGELLGAEDIPAEHGSWRRMAVIRTAPGRVVLAEFATLQSLELLEAPSRSDLEFLVDRSRASTAGDSRTVRVAVEGRAEDLRVSYVIPAPVWRVSYRVARDGDDATLTAWGIVHNPADEDLDAIELTLTTGQPVSFVIDLYNPKSVRRTVVEETSRAVAGPTAYERAPTPAAPRAARPAPSAPTMSAAQDFEGLSFGGGGGGSVDAMHAAAAGASELTDRGELFEYRVRGRVSIKRGGSAMVPLLAARLPARKERIWRDGMGASPDLVLAFDNASGAVLEEGPAVIYDEDVYAGEAMVAYSARGTEVRLGYARDLGVRCKRSSNARDVVSGVKLGTNGLIEERRREEHLEVQAESDHDEEVELIVELARTTGRTLSEEFAKPFEETLSYRRFKLKVPARSRATLRVVERWLSTRSVRYDQLTGPALTAWLEGRFLDKATYEQLAAVRQAQDEAAQLDAEAARIDAERTELFEKQRRTSEQLKVLKDGGAEGELRLRYVRELEDAQNRVNVAEVELRALRTKAIKARASAAAQLAAMVATAS